MVNRLKQLDPQASPLALFGFELRTLRLQYGMTLPELGRAVHVGPNLLGKIERAQRRPQPDLIDRLETRF